MTVADPSATTAAPAPAPEHQSVREFTRLAAHARLITAGILLLSRCCIIGLFIFIWPAVTEPSYYGNAIPPDQLIEVMFTAAITIWCIQLLMPWQSRPIRTALLTTIAITLWIAIYALLFWTESMADRREHLMRLATVITAAATLATIAARYARLLLHPTDLHSPAPSIPTPAASFARFCLSCATILGDADTCPSCGRTMPRPDLRPALDREITRMRTAWQSSLLNLRCLALLIGTLILTGIAQSWTEQFRYESFRSQSFFDLVLWLTLGALTGLGVSFLMIHRPRPSAAITAAGVVFLSMAAGMVVMRLTDASSLSGPSVPALFRQCIALASISAAVSTLVGHSLLTIVITHFAPRVAAQLMLGRTIDRPAPPTASPPLSPRTCESCGYQLEGLPATRCETCSIVALRCPECGHTQPANTINARALRLIYRMHTAVRAITWLVGLGSAFCLLSIWFGMARFVSMRQSLGRFTWQESLGFFLISFIIVSPLRLLLLHGRPWLMSLLVALLPAVAMLLGSSTGSSNAFYWTTWAITIFLVPGWLIVSFSIPYLWRLWTWLILGPAIGRELFQWHRSPAYRHNSIQQILTDPDRALGHEIPLQCAACRTTIPAAPTSACPTCGIHPLTCPTCQEHYGISAVRIGFESILHRVRLTGLALLAIVAACVTVIMVFADFINGEMMLRLLWYPQTSGYYVNGYLANTIGSGAICAILFGTLGRMALIRRPPIVTAIIIALVHAFWFVVAPLPFLGDYGERAKAAQVAPRLLTIFLVSCVLTYIVARLSRPVLRLAMYCVSPNLRQSLYQWITGKQTLNQVGQQLS